MRDLRLRAHGCPCQSAGTRQGRGSGGQLAQRTERSCVRGAGHTMPALTLCDASTAPHQGARPHTSVLVAAWGRTAVALAARGERKE